MCTHEVVGSCPECPVPAGLAAVVRAYRAAQAEAEKLEAEFKRAEADLATKEGEAFAARQRERLARRAVHAYVTDTLAV